MRNPPAFQFYADDFLAGTFLMSDAEVGKFMRALCIQWTTGGISDEARHKLGIGSAESGMCQVAAKFSRGEDGLWKNARLEAERAKQTAFRALQSQKAQARHKLGTSSAQDSYMPEACSPSPSPSPNKRERESSNPVELPKGFPPNEIEAANHAGFVGCTEDFAKQVWNEAAARGGYDCFGKPVVNFRAYLAARAASDRSRKAERKTYQGGKPAVIAKHTADSWK